VIAALLAVESDVPALGGAFFYIYISGGFLLTRIALTWASEEDACSGALHVFDETP
jgi:hypothetical protein